MSGSFECAGNVGCSPFAGQTGLVSPTHTVAIHSPSAHSIEYGLFGGQAMPGMLSPSSSLGKNGIGSLSLSLSKVAVV